MGIGTRALIGFCLLLGQGAWAAAQLDTFVLTQVGKGRFIPEAEIPTKGSDEFFKEYEKINSVGCRQPGWGAMSDGKFDRRIQKGMSYVQYIEQSGDDGHRAGAWRSVVTNVDLGQAVPVTEQLVTALMTKGFEKPAPLYNKPARFSPVPGDTSLVKCTEGICQNSPDVNLWSIVNEVGHANANGESCGLKDSTNDIRDTLERGTYVFADGKRISAYRMTSWTRYPIYCGQQNVEPGENIDVKIVSNDLPSLGSPFGWHCGGVQVSREYKLVGRNSGKVYWQHKQEIVQQVDR
jgi:hypothetical protein